MRSRLLAAAAVTGLALAAAAPTNAMPRSADPAADDSAYAEHTTVAEQRPSDVYDENGKRYCWKKTDGDVWEGYRDGQTTTYWDYKTGKNKTYRCVDGTWVEVLSKVSQTSGPYTYASGDSTYTAAP
jgi:hypothetical protein